MKTQRITVVGDGSWGTTLAIYLANLGHPVTLWSAFPSHVRYMEKKQINEKFLPGVPLPKNIEISGNLALAVTPARILVLAVPSQYLRGVLKKMARMDLKDKIVLSVVKGIDPSSLQRMSEVIAEELGKIKLAVLSGPTIASEVVHRIPTTAVIASRHQGVAQKLQKIFHSESFRIYRNTDVVGVEMGGSLKNIIAIACGVCDGLGYGSNTKAAILTRGLVEMSRLGCALGARARTFAGLAGLGDLVTTCVSPQSRNRSVGEELGRGRSIKDILGTMDMVAQGVVTAKAVHKLSRKMKISMPITQEVYRVIYQKKNPRQAVNDLMTRQLKAE